MEKISIERSIWINVPRERVWQAVTDSRQIGKWWPPDEWDIPQLKAGEQIKFGKEDTAYGTIAIVDPPHKFVVHWQPTKMFPTNTMTSLVLEEENGGTRLNVAESGFESLPDDIRDNRIANVGEGYTLVLASLKTLLEQAA
jgi:uncharacterized protein YndB with AHSA1/START domain